MLYATKGNQQYRIEDDQKDAYAAKGYSILDGDGNAVECEFHTPVPYDKYVADIKAAKSTKVKNLEARIAELEAQLKADDFE